MEYVKIINGSYAGRPVIDQVFPLVKSVRSGRRGLYVTVTGSESLGTQGSNIRILVPNQQSVVPVLELPKIVVPEETDEQLLEHIDARFKTLEQMTRAVATGQVYALVVSGPGGVGKSFGVKKVLSEIDAQRAMYLNIFSDESAYQKPSFQIISGYMRAVGIYKSLYDYKKKCEVSVFDDCDSVTEDETSLNLLKKALDTQEERLITYGSETSALTGYEKQFIYRGGVIFITNKKFDNIRENGALGEHLQAILTRCHYIDLQLDTDRAKFLRIKQVVKSFGMLRNEGFSEKEENVVLAYIAEHKESLRDLSLRMALKIANLIRIDKDGWREVAKQTCMKRI
jgi:hypothetical protein